MCGGSGAALAVVAVLLADPTLLAAGLLLTAAGLGVLFFKIGRPRRFLHVFRQPRRSWMSREAWAAAALFPLGAAYALSGWAVFAAATAAAAVAFLVCQGMILRCAKGIPVWRAASTAAVMVCTGCTEGIGLACLVHPAAYALAAAIALRGVAWLVFSIELQRAGVPVRSHAALRAVRPWLFWGGTVAPLLLLFAGWMLGWTPSTAAAAVGTPAMAAAAVITVAAGWLFKFTLVTRAAYHQGYALKHADTDIKPGWLRADTPRH